MKVQVTARVETFVTMEVEVPDDSPETVESAMHEVMADTDYSFEHDSIVETEMVGQEISSYTKLEEEPLPDKYHFRCEKCRKVHKMDGYPIAQLASGNALIHTCDACGNKTNLEPEMIKD